MNSASIQAAFRQVFVDSRSYGRNTFIIGKDPINRTIKRNIIEHYLVGYEKEVPLLVFAYTDELNSGFVLTNFRLIWRFSDGAEEHEIYLDDIARAEAGRFVLARTMTITDVTGKEYPRIYMTGMDNVDRFVAQFNEFIALINGVDDEDTSSWPSYDNEPSRSHAPVKTTSPVQNRAPANNNDYLQFLASFIEKTFARREFIFDRYVYHFGRDSKSNEKIQKAVSAYANLKNGEAGLVCCDITAFGGAEDGVLLTNQGIYIHNPFESVHYFPYGEISSIELKGIIVKDIYINGFKVESPTGFGNTEKQNFAALLRHFKDNL